MILSYSNLDSYKKKGVLIDGCFDPIHEGHIAYFREAQGYKYPVFCSVESDLNIIGSKKRVPLLNETSRIAVLDSIRYIDYVFLNVTTTSDILKRLHPVMYIKGKDWMGRLPNEEKMICRNYKIEIVYLDTVLNSSTKLLKKFAEKMSMK